MFPYKRLFNKEENYLTLFQNIQHFEKFVKDVKLQNLSKLNDKFKQNYFYLRRDNIIILETIPESYCAGDILADFFTEELRVKSNVKGKISPYDYWSKLMSGCDPHFSLREKIYQETQECTQFKAILTAKVIDLLSQEIGKEKKDLKILDPCGGWGDRLIGNIASNVREYTVVDPNRSLIEPYKKIIETFCNDTHVTIVPKCFEDCKIRNDYYDIVFTSPPFGDFEIYSGEDGPVKNQCALKYSSNEEWITEWLFRFFKKSIESLRKNGIFALYLNDTSRCKCTQRLLNYAKTLKNNEHIGTIGCRTGKKRCLPLWIWKKL